MLYRSFGATGWQVSAIGLGTWNIGNQWGDINETDAFATICAAIDAGMNLCDTADAYGIPFGLSEERLGCALAGKRNDVYIVGKGGNWGRRSGHPLPMTSPDHVRLCAHASLYRLRTDWIDVLLCHESGIADPTVYLEGFEALKQEGKIRCYGVSTGRLDVLKKFNTHGACSVVEVDYSLLNRAPEAEFLPYCADHGIAVLIRGPLAKGLLSGNYSADTVFTDTVRRQFHTNEAQKAQFEKQIAVVGKLKENLKPGADMIEASLQFVASHPVLPCVIPGAKSPQQAQANARAGETAMSEQERMALASLTE